MAMHLNENLDDNGEMHNIDVNAELFGMMVLLILLVTRC